MINEIHIKNFKSLKDVKIIPKKLNLLVGLNGMGKSSLIQSLLLLKQSRNISTGRVSLNDDFVEIGKGRDAMYQFNQDDLIKIHIVTNEVGALNWDFKYNPESDFLDSDQNYPIQNLQKCALFNSNFQYLHAERTGPKTIYDTSYSHVIDSNQLGKFGEYSVHYLNAFGPKKITNTSLHHEKAKSDILMHQVDAWLSEITPGVKLNTTDVPGTDNVLIDYQFENGSLYTNRFRPKNVGFGISYVLPVIVALLTAQEGRLIIIENPESHIHPRGQAELGKLIAKASTTGAQIFIETHSDHIINGIRVAVKNKIVDKDEVNIMYFERVTEEGEQYSKYTRIRIDKNGELEIYPANFLDEWNNQLLNLL